MYRLEPYLDIMDSVVLEENRESFFKSFYDDLRNFGSITCLSDPSGAEIFLNDSSTGKSTPATLNQLWPGVYKITCKYPQFRDKTLFITVHGGEAKISSFFPQDTSQCVDYNYYTSDFPATHTYCVEADHGGIIWGGNYPGGLVKIEGSQWTYYNMNNSILPDNSITSIVIDKDNNKWIGTSNGLIKIDADENWTIYNYQTTGIEFDFIMAMASDNNGKLFIATTNYGTRRRLISFDGFEWKAFQFPGLRVIVSLAVDNQNRLWVGLDQGILLFVDDQYITPPGNFEIADLRLKIHSVESIAVDINGLVWIGVGTPRGGVGDLFNFDGTNYNLFSLPERYISHINVTVNGNIWISCHGKYPLAYITETTPLLFKIDPDFNITGYSYKSIKIASTLLKWSAADRYGNLWIGSRDMGLIKFKRANL